MFPEDVHFEFVLIHLEGAMVGYEPPVPNPMRCDRWIARSSLQKGIRRGEVEIAQRALATLLEQDRYGIWRHLIVIALEDVGVASMDIVSSVVAASRNRPWRTQHGGEWRVASFLVKQMAQSAHCQAACDLLLKATNCPTRELQRVDALDAESAELVAKLEDDASLECQAIAALALGGGLVDGQQQRDAMLVFDILAWRGCSPHVVATCRAAWRTSRNPMALLLPLVWQWWSLTKQHEIRDDDVPDHSIINGVPDYAVDQFTRVGGQVARAYLAQDIEMGALFSAASISVGQQPRTLGDLLFLIEGGLVTHRPIWPVGDSLRFPHRSLPGAARLGGSLSAALGGINANRPLLLDLRRQYLPRPLP